MITAQTKKMIEQAVRDALIASDSEPREEQVWLNEQYERFYEAHDCHSRQECDSLLYELTFHEKADRSAAGQKIRFWRSGRYFPRSRKVCEAFADALSLSEEERLYLIRNWFERSDRAFSRSDLSDPEYRKRLAVMNEMREEFIMKIPPEEFERTDSRLSENSLRHLYCISARSYLCASAESFQIAVSADSVTYANRFAMDMKLFGEISRTTMIRHILILCAPYLSSAYVCAKLTSLGYAPLDKDHRSRKGLAKDRLLCDLLDLYQEISKDASPQECEQILKGIMVYTDDYLQKQNMREFSFMRSRFLDR